MSVTFHHADLLSWLDNYDGERFQALLSDPPYFLNSIVKRFGSKHATPAQPGSDKAFQRTSARFMGQTWDGFKSPRHYQEWVTQWGELLIDRVMHPGAIGLFFGGTRTYHRLTTGLEDAGWEIVDCLMVWTYSSGMPKAHNIAKAFDRAAGQPQPVVGIKQDISNGKPMSVAQAKMGVGQGIHSSFDRPWRHDEQSIQRSRSLTAAVTPDAQQWQGYRTALKPSVEPIVVARVPRLDPYYQLARAYGTGALNINACRVGVGRYPSNTLYVHHPDCDESCHPDCHLRELDRQSGKRKAGGSVTGTEPSTPAKHVYGEYERTGFTSHNDEGGASRFFYQAKPTQWERNKGVENGNSHPTLKPIQLLSYLATLLKPPQRTLPNRILIPFSGSGSEIIGAHLAGWDEIVGVEQSADYINIARQRLAFWERFSSFEEARQVDTKRVEEQRIKDSGQQNFFGLVGG